MSLSRESHRSSTLARVVGRNPIFQTLFNFLEERDGAGLALPGLDVKPFERTSGLTHFDVDVTLYKNAHGLSVRFALSADSFSQATAQRMLQQWLVLLAGIAEKPDEQVEALPLMDEAQRQALRVTANKTSTDVGTLRVHQHVEAVAKRTPHAIAVRTWTKQSLTYAELDARAGTRWRSGCESQGVGKDVLVGLCIERSLDMAVALLGVLKAGGAYLPLDAAPGPPSACSRCCRTARPRYW